MRNDFSKVDAGKENSEHNMSEEEISNAEGDDESWSDISISFLFKGSTQDSESSKKDMRKNKVIS